MNHKQQFAALPYRLSNDGGVEILLITSRGTGRWIIPKGWPMGRRAPHKVAAREAIEEAGVKGEIRKLPLGSYDYDKLLADGSRARCNVVVFALEVREELKNWPERQQRQRRWLVRQEAASLIDDEGLVPIVLSFEPPSP
jgi:8-oxo-dGTP pyrophosphatase MutT (NUDIX family)